VEIGENQGMTKLLPLLIVATLIIPATSYGNCDSISTATSYFAFPVKFTEAKCLENAKHALTTELKVTPTKSGDHGYSGGTDDLKVTLDCLQSYGTNGAYLSVAFHASKADPVKVVSPVLAAIAKDMIAQ